MTVEEMTATDRAQIARTIRTPVYHEYLHLVCTDEGWKIVNALWAWT